MMFWNFIIGFNFPLDFTHILPHWTDVEISVPNCDMGRMKILGFLAVSWNFNGFNCFRRWYEDVSMFYKQVLHFFQNLLPQMVKDCEKNQFDHDCKICYLQLITDQQLVKQAKITNKLIQSVIDSFQTRSIRRNNEILVKMTHAPHVTVWKGYFNICSLQLFHK